MRNFGFQKWKHWRKHRQNSHKLTEGNKLQNQLPWQVFRIKL